MTPLEPSGAPTGGTHSQHRPKDLARAQALCWLLDELLDAEDDLLALVARPEALSGCRRGRGRERLGEFCQRVGQALLQGHPGAEDPGREPRR